MFTMYKVLIKTSNVERTSIAIQKRKSTQHQYDSKRARAFDPGWQSDKPWLVSEEGSDGKNMFVHGAVNI